MSYDLHRAHDYSKLIEFLGNLRAHHALESTWLVSYNGAAELRDAVKPYLHAEANVLVTELGPGWATLNMPATATWIKSKGP